VREMVHPARFELATL